MNAVKKLIISDAAALLAMMALGFFSMALHIPALALIAMAFIPWATACPFFILAAMAEAQTKSNEV